MFPFIPFLLIYHLWHAPSGRSSQSVYKSINLALNGYSIALNFGYSIALNGYSIALNFAFQ